MKKRQAIDPENGFADHGGYMSAKISKLEEQFTAVQAVSTKLSNIFEGISIFVNGWTNPTGEELKRIMMQHGGIFHHYQRSHTKFVIASNLPDVKIRANNITKNIVKPEWITDSLRENKLLDYSKYLLYTNKNNAQPKITFAKIEEKDKQDQKANRTEDPLLMSLNALNAKIKNQLSEEKPQVKAEMTRTGTAVDPNFLQEFLNNSRLHHIATLGSGFKYHVTDMRKNHDGKFPDRDKLKQKLKRFDGPQPNCHEVVMHIDMDMFFVSVGLKKYPHFKGHAVAVTHSKGKSSSEDFESFSEIASCSYEARAKGIKNGMFVGQALKLCPGLKMIPYEFEDYRRTAFVLYDSIAKYTLDIEAVSCDELYCDLKNLLIECQIEVMDFVSMLRKEIFELTGCTCSAGIGCNRLQARLATKQAKPNGQYSLLSADIQTFMSDKKIRDLPGVGPNTAYQLEQLNLETCDQLQNLPLQLLQQHFGKKFGETLQQMSNGIDDKKLVFEQVRKSVSVEVNYGIRFNEMREVEVFMQQVCEELSKRLKEIEKKGKLLTLKLMTRAKEASVETVKYMGHGICDKASKSVQLSSLTDDASIIEAGVLKLLVAFNVPAYELRGIGVQLSKLDEERKDNRLIEMFKKATERLHIGLPKVEIEPVKPPTPKKVQKSSPKKRVRIGKLPNVKAPSVSDLFTAQKKTQVPSKKREMIDPDVLKELPPDIVEEILRDYEINPVDESSVDSDITAKPDLPQKQITEPIDDFSSNVFLQDNWRCVAQSWIEDEFYSGFVDMIQASAMQLARLKKLELLFIVMRFLHRVIGDSENSSWRKAYGSISNEVQSEMKKSFGYRLHMPAVFK